MPSYQLIERENGVETAEGELDADLGSGIGPGSEITRDGEVWVIAETRETDRGVALVIERQSSATTE